MPGTTSRLTNKVHPWVQTALQKHSEGEDIEYELMAGPHPPWGVGCILFIPIKSFVATRMLVSMGFECEVADENDFVLGEVVGATMPFNPNGAEQERLTEEIRLFLADMRAQRAEAAQAQIDAAQQQPPLTSGLIVP